LIAFMQCVAEAVMAKGVRGLTEFVPGSEYILEIASESLQRYRERRNREQIREDLRQAAAATIEEARLAAERIAREVASRDTDMERLTVELYLTQIPSAVRRSLRRIEDPTGTTVPNDLRLDTPADMLRRLPTQMPLFRSGQDLPGRPGWKLLDPLGAGGFGEVWKVGHKYADPWAVKFCTDAKARKRFLEHEAEIVARVRRDPHPNVVPLLDAVLEGPHPWLAYEYIGGGDLTGLILSWQRREIGDRVKQVEAALKTLSETAGHFHRLTEGGRPAPIVHRDLKPANILVKKVEAKAAKLMVTDFGIGALAAGNMLAGSRDGLDSHTRAVSMLAGSYSPHYASPQQQRGDPPNPRDDVHALGVIAYQMLTGRLDAAPGARFDRELRELGVPHSLVEVIGDCVDSHPRRQPANATELAERLKVKATIPQPPPPAPPPPPPPGPDLPPKPPVEPLSLDLEPNTIGTRLIRLAAGGLLNLMAVAGGLMAVAALLVGIGAKDGPDAATVLFYMVIGGCAVSNRVHANGQSVYRQFRVAMLAWGIVVVFGVVRAESRPTYIPEPSSSSYTRFNSTTYRYEVDNNSSDTARRENETRKRQATQEDNENRFFGGALTCILEVALSFWFARKRRELLGVNQTVRGRDRSKSGKPRSIFAAVGWTFLIVFAALMFVSALGYALIRR
jgi:serine/threonine protein kinase